MVPSNHLGASKSVVGLVIPTGYSFNLDGTNIYMTLATPVPRPGHQHAPDDRPGTRHPGDCDAHLEGRFGGHRRRLRDACRDPHHRARHPDRIASASCSASTVYERMPRPHQPGRQTASPPGDSRWEGELDTDKLHEAMAHPIALGEELEALPV